MFIGICMLVLISGCNNKEDKEELRLESAGVGIGTSTPLNSSIIVVSGNNQTEIWRITYDGDFYWKGEYIRNYPDIADRIASFFMNSTEFCGEEHEEIPIIMGNNYEEDMRFSRRLETFCYRLDDTLKGEWMGSLEAGDWVCPV